MQLSQLRILEFSNTDDQTDRTKPTAAYCSLLQWNKTTLFVTRSEQSSSLSLILK